MSMKFTLLLLLVAVCAVIIHARTHKSKHEIRKLLNKLKKKTETGPYSSLGCFDDQDHNTGIPKKANYRDDPDNAVYLCYKKAFENGWPAFAVQNGGTCRTGPDIMNQYDSLGESTECKDGLGGGFANDVYIINYEANSLGCWDDQDHDTDIPKIGWWQNEEDPWSMCFEYAIEHGYPGFAMQNGGTCRTGPNILAQFNTLGRLADEDCGDEGLGGGFANDVYQIDCTCLEPTHSFTHIGCWDDQDHNTGIPKKANYKDDMENALDRCFQKALNNGYPAFALQNNGVCRTGSNILNQYDKLGTSNNCGDNGLGGGFANDVYIIACEC